MTNADRRRRLSIPLLAPLAALTVILGGAVAASGQEAPRGTDGRELFERLTSLVGEWRGEWNPGGTPTTVTYRLTGNGSVLLEDYRVGESLMSTLYHLDGEVLMLTHYCSVGNQPRMRLSSISADGREVVFDKFDITNLGEERGYSDRLILTLSDDDHIAVHYRGSRSGAISGVELQRVSEGS